MKIWLIAGAHSGVGKTRLAGRLARVLPNSISVKVGRHKPKKGRPGNYFETTESALEFIRSGEGKNEYCVVESNRLVGKIGSELVIFLDNLDGERRSDSGRLRKYADIILGHRANPSQWRSILSGLDIDPGMSEKVLDTLREQHDYLRGSRLALRTKIWFARDGQVVFGEGLARLLYGVDRHGSLSAAARAEGISYRKAWGDIKRAEERMGIKMLERSIGGRSGGGAKLTDKARRLLDGYEALKRKTVLESDRWFRKLLEDIKIDS